MSSEHFNKIYRIYNKATAFTQTNFCRLLNLNEGTGTLLTESIAHIWCVSISFEIAPSEIVNKQFV